MNEPLTNGLASHTGDATPPPLSAGRPVSAPAGDAGFDLAAVVDRHQSALLRYVGHLVGHEADGQDVVQEAFLRLHRQVVAHGAASVQSVPAWLARVAHHLAMDLVRKRQQGRRTEQETIRRARTGETPTQETADHLGDMARREAADRALAELRNLPADLQQVLLLRLIQGLKLSEIAQAMGLTTGNVAYRINQGLSELARRLKECGVV